MRHLNALHRAAIPGAALLCIALMIGSVRAQPLITFSGQPLLTNESVSAAPTAGLVGYWSFDDETAGDQSGYHNDGERIGGPIPVNGVCGKAMFFDGIDDYIRVPASRSLSGMQTFSLSYWIKFHRTTPGTGNTIGNGSDDHPNVDGFFTYTSTVAINHILGREGDAVRVRIPYDATVPLYSKEFSHVVFILDTESLSVYLDGRLIDRTARNGIVNRRNYDWFMGWSGDRAGDSDFMHGMLDEVRIYNRAITEAEVKSLFRARGGCDMAVVNTADAAPTICRGDAVRLRPAVSGGVGPYSYRWFPSIGLDDPTALNPIASPESTTTYTLVAYDAEGCNAQMQVVVNVKECGCEDLGRNLIGYWSFNDGTARDQSGYNNNGDMMGNPMPVDAHCGTGMYFDGVDDYIRVPRSAVLDSMQTMTVSYWIKHYRNRSGTGNTIGNGSDDRPTNSGFYTYTSNGAINHLIGHNENAARVRIPYDATVPLEEQDFTFITFVLDRESLKAYKNGELVDMADREGRELSRRFDWYMGWSGDYSGDNLHMKGILDEVRIYNRPLSEIEVQALYRCCGEDPIEAECTMELAEETRLNHEICLGDHVELGAYFNGAREPVLYSWSPAVDLNSAHRQSPIAAPTSSRTYVCTAIDADGCEASASFTVIVRDCGGGGVAGIDDAATESGAVDLQVVPNPAGSSTALHIKLSRSGHVRIGLVNGMGETVAALVDQQMAAGEQTLPVDLSDLASGLYFVRLELDGRHVLRQIQVVR